MLRSELSERVRDVIQDSSFTEQKILSFLNEGLVDVAADIRLPDLVQQSAVDTVADTASVDLPSDYHRDLFHVYSVSRDRHVKSGNRLMHFKRFLQEHRGLDRKGSVFDAAISGKELWYQAIPDSPETLRLFYYRRPSEMTLSEDTEPDGLPISFHAQLLVPFVSMKLFNLIEDGLEPEGRINTNVQASYYQQAKNELQGYLGPEDEEPDYIYDDNVSILDFD